MTHTYLYLFEISFLGGGIDTKIFVDRKNFPISDNALLFLAPKKQKNKKKNNLLFFSFLFCLPLPRLKVFHTWLQNSNLQLAVGSSEFVPQDFKGLIEEGS